MSPLRSAFIGLFAILLILSTAFAAVDIGTASSRGNPSLSPFIPDNTVNPGDDTTLEILILNGGDIDFADDKDGREQVTTARNVRLTLESRKAPITIDTGTKPIGNIPQGVTDPIGFDIHVDDDAEPGTYDVRLEAKYRYTQQISGDASPVYQERQRTRTYKLELDIDEDARFEIHSLTTNTFADGTGTVTVEVDNVGQATANDSRFTLTSSNARLTFDGAATAETFVGDWAPGERRELRFQGDIAEQADRRPYLFTATIDYQDADGVTQTSDTLYSGTVPGNRTTQFSLAKTATDVAIGNTGNLSVSIFNNGPTTAQDARLTLHSEDPKLTFAGQSQTATYLGHLHANETKRVDVEASIADGADIRDYPLTGTLTYVDPNGDTRESDLLVTTIRPDPGTSQFAIQNASGAVAAGESGPVTLELLNTDETVRDARLQVVSQDPKLTFGGAASTSTYVGTWKADETLTVTYTADMADRADIRPYPLAASVTYKTTDGETRESDAAVTGILPQIKRFSITDTRSSLAVGEEGTLGGTLVNTGQTSVQNAVVVFESSSQTVTPIETEYRIGTLGPNEQQPFEFDIDISDTSSGGPRQFTVHVRYRDINDDVRRSDPIDIEATVGDKQDAFTVTPVRATFSAGASGPLRVRVTNNGNQPYTDISAKLFTDSPLSSDDDEAFISELAPGESAQITFGLSVSSSALVKVYPAEIDFQYDDADGDTLLSDTYKIPVQVQEDPSNGPSPALILVAVVFVVLVAGGAYYWVRRR